MILYNVTVSIDPEVHEEWIEWMRSEHIPDVMKTGHFEEARIARVHAEEQGGYTFAIGYICKSQEQYDNYKKEHAPRLQKEHASKFAGKFAAFRTMLTVIEEFKK